VSVEVPEVVLDACVLYPMPLCDTLLRLASRALYRPRWTDAILDEAIRNLIADGRIEASSRRRALMVKAFPEAMIVGYEELIELMPNHAKDRHVAAAAVHVQAQAIVTANLRDFEALPSGVQAWAPDAFLLTLLAAHEAEVLDVLGRQASALRHPPTTVTELLDRLVRDAPRFAAIVRGRVADR
jgi:hypothetical protein